MKHLLVFVWCVRQSKIAIPGVPKAVFDMCVCVCVCVCFLFHLLTPNEATQTGVVSFSRLTVSLSP